jgi:hypothetical protein
MRRRTSLPPRCGNLLVCFFRSFDANMGRRALLPPRCGNLLFCFFRSFGTMKFQATLPSRGFLRECLKPHVDCSAIIFERRPLVLYVKPLFIIAVPPRRLAILK